MSAYIKFTSMCDVCGKGRSAANHDRCSKVRKARGNVKERIKAPTVYSDRQLSYLIKGLQS